MFKFKMNDMYCEPILQTEKELMRLLEQEYINQIYFDNLVLELKEIGKLNQCSGFRKEYIINILKRYESELSPKILIRIGRLLRNCRYLNESKNKQYKIYRTRDITNHVKEDIQNINNVIFNFV